MRRHYNPLRQKVFLSIVITLASLLVLAVVKTATHHSAANIKEAAATGSLSINYSSSQGDVSLAGSSPDTRDPNCILDNRNCPQTTTSPATSTNSAASSQYVSRPTTAFVPKSTYIPLSNYTPSYLTFPSFTPSTVYIPTYTPPPTSTSPTTYTPRYTYAEAYNLAQQNCNAILAARNASGSSAVGVCIQAELRNFGY